MEETEHDEADQDDVDSIKERLENKLLMKQGIAVNMEDPVKEEVEPEINPETGLPVNQTANNTMDNPMKDL